MRKPKESVICRHCGSLAVKRNGKCYNVQRYICNSCGKTFSKEGLIHRYSYEEKARAIKFYLNNCGVRKTALFMGCSPGTIINWIRVYSDEMQVVQPNSTVENCKGADIVEMDEIYTICKKN